MKARHVLFVPLLLAIMRVNMVPYRCYRMKDLIILPIMMIWPFSVVRDECCGIYRIGDASGRQRSAFDPGY